MKKILTLWFAFYAIASFSQEEDAWVFFADKPNAQQFISNPLQILTQRAIDRRIKQNIAIDETDAPIHQSYYNQIQTFTGITVLAKSKWMNALHVQGTEEVLRSLTTHFDFVSKVEFANKSIGVVTRSTSQYKKVEKFNELTTDFNYGNAANQINMISAKYLHEKGFTGEGMIIAIFDAGFPNVDTMQGFERIRNANKILGGYDFVERSSNFYSGHSHGTHVLSTIAGYVENEFVGTAPDASFYLFRTEEAAQERPIEESLWVEAAEKADSLGVDVINSSLGYYEYDNTNYNYTYQDMNGKTTFVARGAEIASSKGILVVAAAGNEGRRPWRHIISPADAVGVLTIGAVKSDRSLATFSSRGLTSDGRIKPDVMAQGQSSAIIRYNTDNVSSSSGTSFSSPIMAGTVACLWQAFPYFTAEEIKNKIRESSDNYNTPNADFGYGIPNFETAYNSLIEESILDDSIVEIYPNPTTNIVYFKNFKKKPKRVVVYSVLGAKVTEYTLQENKIQVSNLSSGLYFLKIDNQKAVKLIKN